MSSDNASQKNYVYKINMFIFKMSILVKNSKKDSLMHKVFCNHVRSVEESQSIIMQALVVVSIF